MGDGEAGRRPPRVLGVDPGSVVTGYGIVELVGGRLVHVVSGVIRPPAKASFAERLSLIYDGLEEVIRLHAPTAAAVESIPHARHAVSALKLGHARGVVLLAVTRGKLVVTEHNPLEVKKALVGYGKAEKSQVHEMVQRLLGVRLAGPMDRSDALAVAICHLHSARTLSRLEGR